jgi:hypothetical protein
MSVYQQRRNPPCRAREGLRRLFGRETRLATCDAQLRTTIQDQSSMEANPPLCPIAHLHPENWDSSSWEYRARRQATPYRLIKGSTFAPSRSSP